MNNNTSPVANKEIVQRHELNLASGETTSVYAVFYSKNDYYASIEVFEKPTKLLHWTTSHNVSDAINGGFILNHRSEEMTVPLGIHRVGGKNMQTVPFSYPKSGVYISEDKGIHIVHADNVDRYLGGDFLQAGPMVVRNGSLVDDFERISSKPLQFDDDISLGRFPRAAIGLNEDSIITVSCDGYASPEEPGASRGLTLHELGRFMVSLGAKDALNLDGGSRAAHIAGGRLINLPRGGKSDDYKTFPLGREIMSAITILPNKQS